MLLLWYNICLFSVMYAEMFEELILHSVVSINFVINYRIHYIHFNETTLNMVLEKYQGSYRAFSLTG